MDKINHLDPYGIDSYKKVKIREKQMVLIELEVLSSLTYSLQQITEEINDTNRRLDEIIKRIDKN